MSYRNRQAAAVNPTFWMVRGCIADTGEAYESTHKQRGDAERVLAELLSEDSVTDLTLCKLELVKAFM